MDENLHNTDDIFKKAYVKFEEKAPENMWGKIKANLDKADEKKRRRFPLWVRIASVVLLLVCSFVIYETSFVKKNSVKNEVVAKEKNNPPLNNTDENKNSERNTSLNNINSNKSSERKNQNFNEQSENTANNKPATKDSGLAGNGRLTDSGQYGKSGNYGLLEKNSNKKEVMKVESHTISKSEIKKKITSGKNPKQEHDENYIVKIKSGKSSEEPGKKNFTVPENKPVSKNRNRINASAATPLTLIASSTERIILPDLKSNSLIEPLSSILHSATSIRPPKLTIQKNKKFRSYWEVSSFFSNDWAGYRIDNDIPDNGTNSQNESEEVSKREEFQFSYSTGAFLSRQFRSPFGIKTGLIYSNNTIAISPHRIYAVQESSGKISYQFITSSGYGFIKPGFGLPPAIGDSIESVEGEHNLQIFSVPIAISYRIEKKKWAFMPSVGFIGNFITKATLTTKVEDALDNETETIDKLQGMHNFYVGIISDVNFQYMINKRFSLSLFPNFKYAITPLTKENVVNTFPYSFGIGASVNLKF